MISLCKMLLMWSALSNSKFVNTAEEYQLQHNVLLGVKMFKAISLWLDQELGVSRGWGGPIVLLGLAVLLQVVVAGISLHKAGWLRWLAQYLQ